MNCLQFRRPLSIPESGIYPGDRNGNPHQCSCLENSMDRGIWWPWGHERVGQDWVTNPHFHFIYNNETTKRDMKMKQSEKHREEKGDCWQPKTTKKGAEDGIWGPDRRRILSMEGRRDGDKDVCRCRQGSPWLSGKSGGGRQEGI